jgi:threonine dehydrogenase-like Zn-dependent dehydrogenase
MKAVVWDFSIPRFVLLSLVGPLTNRIYLTRAAPIRLAEVPEPKLPGPDWAIVRTRLAGICASDMSAIRMKDSPTLTPFASFPFILGHENTGTIAEAGSSVKGFGVGRRVVVNPALSCEARGVKDPCAPCSRGETSVCGMMADGPAATGVNTGYSRETGGGWSPFFLAHRSQLYDIEGVTDEEAVMIDAFCSALHAVLKNRPADGDTVLVIGAGPIGLSAIQSIRALGGDVTIIVLEPSSFSGQVARQAGADHVIGPGEGPRSVYERVAEITGARLHRPIMGDPILVGGVDKVFDTVGHGRTIQTALRLMATGGVYCLIGLAGIEKADLTPLWFKEITVIGSLGYGREAYGGKSVHTWDVALDMIRKKKVRLGDYVTHTFALEQYRRALRVNLNKGRYRAIKTAFVYD